MPSLILVSPIFIYELFTKYWYGVYIIKIDGVNSQPSLNS